MAARKVLLVGWDAADWKVIHPLVDGGEMPYLARVIEQGVIGDMPTLQPSLSPMLWTSIATGKYADQHGVVGFTEVDPATGGVRPATSTSRQSKALWNILTQKGYRTSVVNWFAGHPAEAIRGVCVSDALTRGDPGPGEAWKILPGTVHPAELADEICELRVQAAEIDGQLLQLFVPRAAEIDQAKDRRLLSVARTMAESFTVHAAATWVIERQGWDFLAVYYPSIDHFGHGFMHYHPPKQDWVDQRDFELYSDVVNSGYRLHDRMLGTLLEMAGPEVTLLLVSDHGFHSDHLRLSSIPKIPAGPALQHRQVGVFAMMGPGVRRDERIYGLKLVDVAPTVLSLYGLPAGKDMPGRVLSEAFEFGMPLERIETWESVPGESGMHAGSAPLAPEDAQALLRQFVALGYIEPPDADQRRAVDECLRERLWNLARVYTGTGRDEPALPLLEQVAAQAPARPDYALALADCQARLGLLDEAGATAKALIGERRDTPAAHWMLGRIEIDRGQPAAALEHLLEADRLKPRSPDLLTLLGGAYLRLQRHEEARQALTRALEIDPHDAATWQAMALCRLRQKDFPAAAEAALSAIGFDYQMARPHFYLGVALWRLGRKERAIQALETAVHLAPGLRAGHAWLARVYSRQPGGREKAWAHQREARDLTGRRLLEESNREALRRAIRERAETRARQVAMQPVSPESAAPAEPEAKPRITPADFIIVSGLPRSGTSLMMQMLAGAGIPVMTDNRRQADQDNPEGYLEWEPVKQVRRKPEVLDEAAGKAVKVVSMLLPWLPAHHRYKVIFMSRPLEEVAASHRKMIERRGTKPGDADPVRLQHQLQEHSDAVLKMLRESASCELLEVDYPGLVRQPEAWIPRILSLLGRPDLDAGRMAAAVRPELHRNKAARSEPHRPAPTGA